MNNDIFFLSNIALESEDHFQQNPSHLYGQTAPLIDWINSFNDPYCLLVNSLNDLKDGKIPLCNHLGVALCHLVGFIACSPQDQEKIRQLVYYETNSDLDLQTQNIDLALNILKSSQLPLPEPILRLTAQDILDHDDSLTLFLETLKQTHDILHYKEDEVQRMFENSKYTHVVIQNKDESQLQPKTIHFTPAQDSHPPLFTSGQKQKATSNSSHIVTPRNLPLQMQSQKQSDSSNRRFEVSMEFNNISPIGQKISVSPMNIQSKKVMIKDPEEEQLEKEIEAINVSYTRFSSMSKNKENVPLNNAVRSLISDQKPRPVIPQNREKWMIKQLQNQNSDYKNVVINSNKKMTCKTIDQQSINLVNEKLNHSFVSDDRQKSQLQKKHNFIAEAAQEPKMSQNDVSIKQKSFVQEQKPQINDEDDIMSEMQTLTVQPESKELSNKTKPLLLEEIKITVVDLKTKHRVLDWLVQEVKLLKKNDKLISDLPLYCKNGVFFCDLINRLGGKEPLLKGIDRNPKNLTSIMANVNKILEYFRPFPKFCARYLWAQKYLIDGNEDVIWGFLDDIWHWHMNKISPFDPASKKENLRSSLSKTRKSDLRGDDFSTEQLKQVKNLPPKVQSKNQEKTDHEASIQHPIHQRVATPNLQQQIKLVPIERQSTIHRENSYSSLSLPKSPLVKNQKQIKNQDFPLQGQVSSKKRHTFSQMTGNYSFTRKSMSRKRDISHVNSPIGKDQTGQLYYHTKQGQRDQLYTLNDRGDYNCIQITDELIQEVRAWLFNLKFTGFLSKEFEHKDICSDPFSNGVLLGELFSYLEKITIFKVIQFPQTIHECRENIQKVLSLIKQRRRDFPSRFLNEHTVENILKRDKASIYQILYFLKLGYQDVQPLDSDMLLNQTNAPVNSSTMSCNPNAQNLQIPYNQAELKLLETSLLNWVKSIGVLGKFGPSYNDVQSMVEIQKELSNGSLLAEIVSTLFNVKVMGIFKDPKTETTARSNIRKSLEILRQQQKMSQKFTWAEKEIYEGQLIVIIGLLEDLHRCFDGLPPRKRGPNYFYDGPYFGDTLYKVQPYVKFRPNNITSKDNTIQSKDLGKIGKVDQCISTINQSLEFQGGLSDRNPPFQIVPSIFSHRQDQIIQQSKSFQTMSPKSTLSQEKKPNFGAFLQAKLEKENVSHQLSTIDYNQRTMSPNSSLSRFEDKNYNPFQPQRLNPKSLILDDQEERNIHKFQHVPKINDLILPQKSDLTQQFPVAPTRSPLNVKSRGQSIEFEGGQNIQRPSIISMDDYEDEQHHMNRNQFNAKEKQKIQKWLTQLKIKLPASFFSENETIQEFRDGILLSQIVGTLEGVKIENIQANPKSTASCLQNIRKSLNLLKKKNQIPLYLLYSEEEIQKGNNEIIFQLLKSLRQAYKNKVTFQVSKQNVK